MLLLLYANTKRFKRFTSYFFGNSGTTLTKNAKNNILRIIICAVFFEESSYIWFGFLEIETREWK